MADDPIQTPRVYWGMRPAFPTRQFEFDFDAVIQSRHANSTIIARSATAPRSLSFGDANQFTQGASFNVICPEASAANPVTLNLSGAVNSSPAAPITFSSPGSVVLTARGQGRGWAVAQGAGGGASFSMGIVGGLSVNDAHVDRVASGVVLRTSTQVLPAGAFNGNANTGNKAILGVSGYEGMPLAALNSIAFEWTNIVGEAGINYNPAELTTTATPYVNLLVDFDPNGGGDIRVLVIITDQLNPLINDSVGNYSNPGGLNRLFYSWDDAQNAMIVGSPPAATPGGVVPDVTVGAGWPENSYKFSDLVSANPEAVLVTSCPDDFANDGGLPSAALVPAIIVNSSDSGTNKKQSKLIYTLSVNGVTIF